MTKDDIVKMVATVFLAAFTRPLVEAYMPSKETIKIYVNKAVIIFFSYLLPIGMLMYLFDDNTPLSKAFVFQVALYFSLLIFNVLLDMIKKLSSDSIRQEKEIIESFNLLINGFSKIHSDHLQLTEGLEKDNSERFGKTIDALTLLSDQIKEIEGKIPTK